MKKMLALVVCSLATLAFSTTANAEAYLGVNYLKMEQNNQYKSSFLTDEASFKTDEVFVRLGGVVNKYVASELRVGSTAGEKKDGDQTFRFNYHVGMYGKAMLPIGPVTPYIVGGYTWGEVETKNSAGKFTGSIKDVSVGGGIDLNIGNVGVNAEYIRYYYIGNVRYRGPSIGLFYRF